LIKKFCFSIVITLCIFISGFFLSGEDIKKDGEKLPEIGSIYKYNNTEWYVRGSGIKAFEYTATGESLCIITIGISGSIVKIPKKDSIVKIDPEIPMIYIDNKPDEGLQSNDYFKKKAKNRVFILLEYKRG